MLKLLKHIAIILPITLPVLSTPIQANHATTTLATKDASHLLTKRAEPSAYPWASDDDPVIENEFKWLNWDKDNEEDKKDGQRIHKAFREWHEFTKAAAEASADHESLVFKRWFSDYEFPQDVTDTFSNMIDVSTGKATTAISKMVNNRLDFGTPSCNDRPNMRAYTVPATGEFHFCDLGIRQPLNSELVCEDLYDYCSGKMKSVTLTFLHETTHFDDIDGTNEGITDVGGNSASKCFGQDGDTQAHNAQNYAWFAADVYWGSKCSKTMKDPPPGTTDMEDGVTIPLDPPGATKALSIVADAPIYLGVLAGWSKPTWKFFGTDYRQPVDCRSDPVAQEEVEFDDLTKPIYPFGVYDFTLNGETCQYRGNGGTIGSFYCGDKDIACKEDPRYENPPAMQIDTGKWYKCEDTARQPLITCEW